MVSSYLPFPLKSGGEIRLYNLIKHLSDKHDITLICEKRDYQGEDDVKELEKFCKKVITIKREKQWSTKNILKTGFSQNPFLITGHTLLSMKQAIKDELVRENYELIHVETFYVLQNLPEKLDIPVVLVEHNIEYLVYKRYAALANPLLRPFLYFDVLKLKRAEEKAWAKADKLVAVSEVEKKIMKRPDVSVVPNGVDIDNFRFRSFQEIPEEKRILFIGDFKWFQNTVAAESILKNIWPKLSLRLEESKDKQKVGLWIIGRNMPEWIKNLARGKDIIADHNNKDDTYDIFRKSYILLAPIKAGGGTSFKIIEAMASGVGVVTTKLGVEGLDAKDGVHVMATDDEEKMADDLFELIKDHSLYKKLTLNSRKLIEENYDWKIISQKLDEVYMSSL